MSPGGGRGGETALRDPPRSPQRAGTAQRCSAELGAREAHLPRARRSPGSSVRCGHSRRRSSEAGSEFLIPPPAGKASPLPTTARSCAHRASPARDSSQTSLLREGISPRHMTLASGKRLSPHEEAPHATALRCTCAFHFSCESPRDARQAGAAGSARPVPGGRTEGRRPAVCRGPFKAAPRSHPRCRGAESRGAQSCDGPPALPPAAGRRAGAARRQGPLRLPPPAAPPPRGNSRRRRRRAPAPPGGAEGGARQVGRRGEGAASSSRSPLRSAPSMDSKPLLQERPPAYSPAAPGAGYDYGQSNYGAIPAPQPGFQPPPPYPYPGAAAAAGGCEAWAARRGLAGPGASGRAAGRGLGRLPAPSARERRRVRGGRSGSERRRDSSAETRAGGNKQTRLALCACASRRAAPRVVFCGRPSVPRAAARRCSSRAPGRSLAGGAGGADGALGHPRARGQFVPCRASRRPPAACADRWWPRCGAAGTSTVRNAVQERSEPDCLSQGGLCCGKRVTTCGCTYPSRQIALVSSFLTLMW